MTAGQVDPNTVLLGFLQEWTIMGPLVALLNCGHISKCWEASPVSKIKIVIVVNAFFLYCSLALVMMLLDKLTIINHHYMHVSVEIFCQSFALINRLYCLSFRCDFSECCRCASLFHIYPCVIALSEGQIPDTIMCSSWNIIFPSRD